MASRPTGWDGVWLEFVADLFAQPLTALPDERIGLFLVETIGAVGGGFYPGTAAEVRTASMWPRRHYAPFAADIREWTRSFAATRHPLLRYYVASASRDCMQVADVPAVFADGAVIGGWRDLARRWGGIGGQVSMPLTVGPAGQRAFVLDLPGPLHPAQMADLRRTQRLLTGLDRQITAFSAWTAHAPAAPESEAARFTPRELAVLHLLARGSTAAAIGRRLGIAERTVQKHLQHVYAKLGVGDRLAAVQRAQAAGVLPGAKVRTSRTSEVPARRA